MAQAKMTMKRMTAKWKEQNQVKGAAAVEDKEAGAAMGYNSNVRYNIVVACFFVVVVMLLQWEMKGRVILKF
eukprot:14858338-Ditylum_brightwellii.AAC.1